MHLFIIYSSLIHYIKSRRIASKLFFWLVIVNLLLSDLKETKHVFSGLLHEDILTDLLSITVDVVDGFLEDSPALSHRQVDLVLIRADISAIGSQNYVMVGVFLVLAGHKNELNLIHTSQNRLHNPS